MVILKNKVCITAQINVKSAGNRKTVERGVNIWKQITFQGPQRFNQWGLSIHIPEMSKLLHEAAFLPATWVAAASYHPLSISSKAENTEGKFCLVPEAEPADLHPHLHPHGLLGGQDGSRQDLCL